MGEFLEGPAVQLVICVAGLAILLAVGIYVAKRIRAESVQHELSASDLMSKYRELHSKGDLSDEEFRTIKTTLAARLEDELRDTGETG